MKILRWAAACAVFLGPAAALRAFLGVADTSFVTVIANPAEAANWAAEISRLSDQLAAARAALQTAGQIRDYAGDPRAAAQSVSGLSDITGAVGRLESGAQTGSDLAAAWNDLGSGGRSDAESALLEATGAGRQMTVFGQASPRSLAAFADLASSASALSQARSSISGEQSARSSVAGALGRAWDAFRVAATESEKQALLAEISQLQAQSQVMDARRRALLDDVELSRRQASAASDVRARAADQQGLAESSLLGADELGRASAAESQRAATLAKPVGAATPRDYSGMRLWTTADAGGQP
ncbi:MAG TPA: hypothetical protein VGG37_08570 [Opitutaceae bacterium]|jgi:hypothetical protein